VDACPGHVGELTTKKRRKRQKEEKENKGSIAHKLEIMSSLNFP
jgi:hypothetical protein